MARPKRQYEIVIVAVKLTLVKGEDDDLLDLFAGTPTGLRAVTVKSALRGQLLQPVAGEGADSHGIADELAGFIL